MSTGRSLPPESVPTLTEVVIWPEDDAAREDPPAEAPVAEPVAPGGAIPRPVPVAAAAPPAPAAPVESEAEVAQRLLAQIQHQLDLAIDVRLREVLTPVLSRAADALVRDARRDMAAVLRDIVARAVEAELAKRRRP